MTSKASICSETRIVPKLDAILEPTFPARIRLTVGLNSRVIDSRVANNVIGGISGSSPIEMPFEWLQ